MASIAVSENERLNDSNHHQKDTEKSLEREYFYFNTFQYNNGPQGGLNKCRPHSLEDRTAPIVHLQQKRRFVAAVVRERRICGIDRTLAQASVNRAPIYR